MDDEEETTTIQKKDEDEEEEEYTSVRNTPSFHRRAAVVDDVSRKLNSGDLAAKVEAARDIRRMVRKSADANSKSAVRRCFAEAVVIEPLVRMLGDSLAREAALLALLNLAARNQRNKISIVTAGAVPPLVDLIKYQTNNLRELAVAAILSLSSAESNKSIILSCGAAPFLVQVLCSASIQGKVDSVTALYNLSNTEDEVKKLILDPKAAPPLIDLLKECKKYSKFAEKTTFLLEILSDTEEGRNAITNTTGGILALVETVEDGSSTSMLNAVGALLSMCKSCRDKYRDLILNEGAIPGLLHLTAEGTPLAQERARTLLDLLRDSPPKKRLTSSELEKIVYNFAAHVDGKDRAVETAKRLLHEMVHKNMELGLNCIKLKDSCCTDTSVQPL